MTRRPTPTTPAADRRGPPGNGAASAEDADRLRVELDRERDRARRAAADARRAERLALEASDRLRKMTEQWRLERQRSAELRGRPTVRLAATLERRAGEAMHRLSSVAGRIRGRPERGPDRAHPARTLPVDAHARSLAEHYRAALLASLRSADGPHGPLRVTIIEPLGEDPSGRRAAAAAGAALSATGASVIRVSGPGDLPADTDVALVADAAMDPLVLPTGVIRVAWADTDPQRAEWDLVLPLGADPGATLVDGLERWLRSTRIAIRTPTGSVAKAAGWGDTYFARDLRAAFRAAGHPARIHFHDAWDHPAVGFDDVVVDLLGVYEPETQAGAVRILWQISHPELGSAELYERYDRVYAASDAFAAVIRAETGIAAVPLHQATDPGRFHPGLAGPRSEVLVVANWRPDRRIVADAAAGGHGITVHGRDWTPDRAGPGAAIGDPIPNDDLAGHYANAGIVLNDHAAGMRREGFLSNRLYDAAACGALVISDAVDGLEAEFDGGVLGYRDAAELRALIDRYLEDDAARARLADRARQAVLDRHTFAHRVATLLEGVEPVLAAARAEPA